MTRRSVRFVCRAWWLLALVSACGSSAGDSTSPADTTSPSADSATPQLRIVSASGGPLHAVAGDAITLKVVVVSADGSMADLPAGADVEWVSPAVVTTLAWDSTAASPLPAFGTDPTAAWIDNPNRPDRAADLANVLFVLDPGTVQNGSVEVSAIVSGAPDSGNVTTPLLVDPAPAGDWSRGASLFGASGANCAGCHGDTGHGSVYSDTGFYPIAGATYPFPAPGINAEPGNAASDPDWNAALFAVAARADMDNGGLTLRFPMPDCLTAANPATGTPLSTQDLADIYAYLKTQTH